MNNQKRNKLSLDTVNVFETNPHLILEYGTGSGKSKIAIDCVKSQWKQGESICYITETLEGRKAQQDELVKWWPEIPIKNIVWRTYAWYRYYRRGNERLYNFDYVIIDEFHHCSELFIHNAFEYEHSFLQLAFPPKLIGLTGTIGDTLKLFPHNSFKVLTYGIKEGEKDNIVSKHEVIPKSISVDTESLNKIHELQSKVNHNNGFDAKNDAKLKGTLARIKEKLILDEIKNIPGKSLIYCFNIAQAKRVCKHSYHSKDKKKSAESLKLFKEGKINQLSCVNALDESANLPELDNIIILQGDSSSRRYKQRRGRAIRWRPNHIGKVYYYYIKYTIDESWFKKHTK